jgi:uncharacterized protein (TIGR03435 family)
MRARVELACAICIGTCAAALMSVDGIAQKPRFEVASVKRNLSGEPNSNANSAIQTPMPGGGYRAVNTTLQTIIQYVYAIPQGRLSGGPNWVRTQRFDIIAKADREVPRDQIFLMVQSLLEERFKLELSKEQREADVFDLKVARSDERLGPDLKQQSESDCKARREAAAAAGKVLLLPTVPPGGVRPTAFGICSTMAALATNLQQSLKTPVTDATGLAGLWDYTLNYSNQPAAILSDPTSGAASLVTALQEQLGLKLERRRNGSIEMFVIKSIAEPVED